MPAPPNMRRTLTSPKPAICSIRNEENSELMLPHGGSGHALSADGRGKASTGLSLSPGASRVAPGPTATPMTPPTPPPDPAAFIANAARALGSVATIAKLMVQRPVAPPLPGVKEVVLEEMAGALGEVARAYLARP